LTFWIREAQKKNIVEQIDQLNSTRLSMGASNTDFSRVINDLQSKLNSIEGTLNKFIAQNWENLKIKKRG